MEGWETRAGEVWWDIVTLLWDRTLSRAGPCSWRGAWPAAPQPLRLSSLGATFQQGLERREGWWGGRGGCLMWGETRVGWWAAAAIPLNSNSAMSTAQEQSCQLSTGEKTGHFLFEPDSSCLKSCCCHKCCVPHNPPNSPPCSMHSPHSKSKIQAAPSPLHPGTAMHSFVPELSFFPCSLCYSLITTQINVWGHMEYIKYKIKLNCNNQSKDNKAWRNGERMTPRRDVETTVWKTRHDKR